MSLQPYQRAANTLEAGRVLRYHAAPTVAPQTVGQHAYGVAALCLYVTDGKASRELLINALLHDSAELVTGDIPFTVKRSHPEVKATFDALENEAFDTLLLGANNPLTPHDCAILKLCDTVEGLIWCRKTELTGPVRMRWLEALNRGLQKFAPFISEEEHTRIVTLVNDENFHPTL